MRKTLEDLYYGSWMFPSPAKENSPLDPATCRKRLQTILDHAGCKRVRFHDLRHLFVTTALESGMDVKTLSAIIGHVSAKTTLNTYTHVTEAMRQTAAAKIDRGIGKCEPQDRPGSEDKGLPAQEAEARRRAVFEPYKSKNRNRCRFCKDSLGLRRRLLLLPHLCWPEFVPLKKSDTSPCLKP